MNIGKSTLEPKYYLDITIHKVICGKILKESEDKIRHKYRIDLMALFTGLLTELPNSVNIIF
jgi:hypothetical protein